MKFVIPVYKRKRRDFQKLPRQEFKVDRSYSTRAKVTKRTLAVSEAFGLGIDETRRFSVFSNFEMEIKAGQIALITGDSGSGKSTLLYEILRQIQAKGCSEFPQGVVSNSSVEIDPNEVLVEGVGKDVGGAISILSMAGLNEAFLMLRKFKDLSDGQKYRYRLAKMIDSKASVWIFDEFVALLDRTTAKVVSYTLQKTARKLGKTVVVATTHEDLLQDFKPDIWIRKGFGDQVQVTTFKSENFERGCSLLREVRILECNHEELKELEKFHYRGSNAGIVRRCFKALIGEELAGGVVYSYSYFSLKGRNIAMPEFGGKTTTQKMKKINQKISRISRVVVHPKFRSIGLGAEIVRRTLPLAPTEIVETVAVMAKYNKFFQAAGMTEVPVPEDQKLERALQKLEKETGLTRELLPSKSSSLKLLPSLPTEKLTIVQRFALNWCIANKFRKTVLIPKVMEMDMEAIAEALSLTRSKTVYLFWTKEDQYKTPGKIVFSKNPSH